jgi:hypothetical protein
MLLFEIIFAEKKSEKLAILGQITRKLAIFGQITRKLAILAKKYVQGNWRF